MKKKIILKSSVLGLVAGTSIMFSSVFADQVGVQVIGVNDFHGALDNTGTANMPDGKVTNAGTAAQLDAYMDDAQKDFKQTNPNGESIRVQAGDMVGASPANSGLLQDEPTVKTFNAMNVEYGTLGNHEFDEGLAEYNRIVTGKAPAPDSNINNITKSYPHEAAKQEIVVANVIDKVNKQIPYNWKPYTIKNIPVNNKSVNVGFIGIVTKDIPNLVLRKNYEQYEFLDEAETIVKYAKELQAKNVKAIVVLAHVPATSKDDIAEGEAAEMMKKVNQLFPENSVDIVFAGHNHQYTNGLVGKTRIVQALSQGKAYADVRGVLDTDTQDFIETPSAKVIAVAPGKKTGSADIQAIVDQANTIVKQVTEAKIGTAEVSGMITRSVDQDNVSPVGSLITEAQLAIARKSWPDIDFAMTNNGGIRADLLIKPDGTITWGAAQSVQPFGNILQVVEITGRDLYKALNEQYDQKQNFFLQIAGLRYTYTDNKEGGEETPFKVVKAYKSNGEEINPDAKYKLVINDFLFGGGDGFASFRNAKLLGAINPDTEVFMAYITDLEKAGKKVSIPNNKPKIYVTMKMVNETITQNDGTYSIIKKLYLDRQGNIVAQEIVSDTLNQTKSKSTKINPVTTIHKKQLHQFTAINPMRNYGKPSNSTTVKSKQLPKTNSEYGQSFLMSVFGVGLIGIALNTKKKHMK